MKFDLVCSENLYKIILEIITNKNIQVDSDAVYAITERNYELPDGKIGIVFDSSTLGYLIDLLDVISKKASTSKQFVLGKLNERYELIVFEKIICFESIGKETYCCTYENRYKVKEKLYELEESLAEKGFIRTGKAYLVNILNISAINPWFGGRLNLTIKNFPQQIEVSRSYVKGFKEYLGM